LARCRCAPFPKEFRISDFEFRISFFDEQNRFRKKDEAVCFEDNCLRRDVASNRTCAVIEYQLVKAGTSVGANYREANRAESRADFIHKIAIVEKESSESCFWLELCDEAGFGDGGQRSWLLQESRELLAIFTSIGKSTKAKSAHV
jgi:four helix bundle protein